MPALTVLVSRRRWRGVRPRPREKSCFWIAATYPKHRLTLELAHLGVRVSADGIITCAPPPLREVGAPEEHCVVIGTQMRLPMPVWRHGRKWLANGREFRSAADVIGYVLEQTTMLRDSGGPVSAFEAHRWAKRGWLEGAPTSKAMLIPLGACCVFDYSPTLCERRPGVFRRTVAKRGKRITWR